jgi:hypothetical protein
MTRVVLSLVSNDLQKEIPTAYCNLSDHTLPVTDIQIGVGAFPSSCRVLTASVDHTVKVSVISFNPSCRLELNPPTLLNVCSSSGNSPPLPLSCQPTTFLPLLHPSPLTLSSEPSGRHLGKRSLLSSCTSGVGERRGLRRMEAWVV